MKKKKTKERPAPSRSNRSEWMDKLYFKSLDALIDRLFEEAFRRKLSRADIARQAGLSETTVRKLIERKTILPQLRTVELLAYAVGGRLDYHKGQEHAKIKTSWTIIAFNARKRAA